MARADVTPPVGIYHRMWGAARHDRATGVHRPLLADVLAFAPAGPAPAGPPAFIRAHVDLVGLAQSQHDRLVDAVSEAVALPPERVAIAYSHTHSSGNFVPNRIGLPGGDLIPGYLQELARRLGEAARQAAARMQDVVITYATGRCALAANRDYWDDAFGGYTCGLNPDVPADDTVLVARMADAQGRLVGTLVNYGCHPTTLAWQNTLISPDFPGAMRETVEQATGAPCVFAQGACGDLGPRRGYVGDPAVADQNGRVLAHAALSVLESMGPPGTDYRYAGPVISGATLGIWEDVPFSAERLEAVARFDGGTYRIHLPLKPLPARGALEAELAQWEARQREADARGDETAARDAGARAERVRRWLGRLDELRGMIGGASPGGPPDAAYPMPFSVLRLGDAMWVACGGEPYSAIQMELRRRFPQFSIVFSPLASGMQVAYLLPRERYGKGLYQEEPSMLAPGCLEQLTEAIAARIAAMAA
jgi:hypothetical protein